MKLTHTLVAATLSLAACASFADSVTAPLDLSSGNGRFGRDNATATFLDTYSFTLSESFWISATATTSAGGSQNLNFSSLVIQNAANNVVATFAGNLGNDQNEFYALAPTQLGAGIYRLLVSGTNSPTQASYSGTIAAITAVPEPSTVTLMGLGFGAMALFLLRRRARPDAS